MECGKEISDKAPVCPHCGYVVNAGTPVNKTLVQLDSAPNKRRKYKVRLLVFMPMWALGSMATLGSIVSHENGKLWFWFLVATVGLVGTISSSIGHWLAEP